MEWIKCSERLPTQEQRCLYFVIKDIPGPFNENPAIISGYFSGDQFYDFVDAWPNDVDEVSHWSELPKPPKD